MMLTPVITLSQDLIEFSAGRPGASETTSVIPKGLFQFESGWTQIKTKTGNGNFMVRLGLANRVEVRFSLDEVVLKHNPFYSSIGSIIMFQITEERNNQWGSAVIMSISLPEGTDLFSSDPKEYSFIAAFSASLSRRISLGWNLGGSSNRINNESFKYLKYSICGGYDLTEKIGVFIEMYGWTPTVTFGEFIHSIDGGVIYQLFDTVQIDVNTGLNQINDLNEIFVDFGIVFRLPK